MKTQTRNAVKILSIKGHKRQVMNQRSCCDNCVGDENRFFTFTLVDEFTRFVSSSRVQVKVDKTRE